jgi:hypothetical protein
VKIKLARKVRWVERNLRWPVVALCGYEAVALILYKPKVVPPVSVLMNHHKWAIPFVCGTLAAHVWWLEVKSEG